MTHTALAYRRDIDGLRALAVSSVVGYHAFPQWLPGGFIGVDIFFVISGYLITGILLKQQAAGSFSILDFYARRIRRLFPALLLVLTACLVAAWLFFLADEFVTFGKNVVASVFFVTNLFLWTEADYFDIASEFKPLLHLWSLAVEEQFYIVWPALLFMLAKRRQWLLPFFLVLAAASFLSAISDFNDSVSRFYLPNNRFWELMAGALLALPGRWHLYEKIPADLKAALGLCLLVAGLFLINKHSVFPGWWALLPVLGAFLLLSVGEQSWISRVLFANPVAVFVGLISYPLYLWHWPMLAFAKVLWGAELSILVTWSCIGTSVLCAWLSYRLVEIPLRTPRSGTILALLISALVLAAVGYAFAREFISPRTRADDIKTILLEIQNWERIPEDRNVAAGPHYFFGTGSEQDVVFLIGDSNMEQYAARINQLMVSRQDKGVMFAIEGGCTPVPDVASTNACRDKVHRAYRYAMDTAAVSTVVVSALWIHCFDVMYCVYDAGAEQTSIRSQPTLLYDSLRRQLKALTTKGKKVFLVGNIPSHGAMDPRKLFDRAGTDFKLDKKLLASGVARNEFARIEEINRQLALVAADSGAIFINPFDYVCDSRHCPMFTREGHLIYKDQDHFSVSFVKERARFIDPVME